MTIRSSRPLLPARDPGQDTPMPRRPRGTVRRPAPARIGERWRGSAPL